MKYEVLLPFCESGETPLYISIIPDATVEELIGYCLSEYIDSKKKPTIPQNVLVVSQWHIRIGDDGEIDDDFPGNPN
jgi:hypothetical protein